MTTLGYTLYSIIYSSIGRFCESDVELSLYLNTGGHNVEIFLEWEKKNHGQR